jgi:hypothetical protein
VQATGGDEQKLTQIADVCRWYASAGPPTGQRQAAALAELAHITADRTHLLAQFAGHVLAQPSPVPDPAGRDRAVQLCITAGADMTLIDHWSRESRPEGSPAARSQRPSPNRA